MRARHRRPSKAASLIAGTVPVAVATGIVISGGTAAHAQVTRPAPAASSTDSLKPAAAIRQPIAAAAVTVTVRRGNTLAGIARSDCGSAADWTGIYAKNRAVIGGNPDLIIPGQKLVLDCRTAAVTSSGVHADAHVHLNARHIGGKVWGKTYGYPNLCGDGDGDGWDVNCQTRATHHVVTTLAAAPRPAVRRAAAVSSSSGTYSFAGLEALWVSAGGPAWAEAQAARVAECESGGRVNAFNPSGATGLWQILGAVVGGNLDNAYTNALNAVSKFKASGETWAQWVCKP